jgi:hypothetical protein
LLLVLPAAVLGLLVLTRSPFGVITGMVAGFAAGWALRGEYGGSAAQDRARRAPRGDDGEAKPVNEKIDEMVEESFPASDPPSYTATRAGKPSSG